MNSRSIIALAALSLLLQACGNQADGLPSAASPRQAGQVGQVRAQLGEAPTNRDAARDAAARAGTQRARAADGAGLAIDTQDREAVRLFYNQVYQQPEAAMDWTGSYLAPGLPGGVSPAWQAATSLRINWFRAMAGLPAATTIDPATSAKAQAAALLMSANGQLSHTPPASWTYYTPTAAEAAGSSNLALGQTGAAAIDAYIADYGDNNAVVGHRRWLLYPQTRAFGSGDVPRVQENGAMRYWGANALWVFDGNFGAARPRVRDDFVAWPTRGHVPYQVVYGRWSLSYPDADFARAQVSVTRAGAAVATTIESTTGHYGENTIAWKVAGIPRDGSHERPAADLRYHVTVSGVSVAGATRSFDYDVVVFDPAVATPGAPVARVDAPASVRSGDSYTARVAQAPGASGYSLLSYRRSPLAALAASDYGSATWSVAANASAGTLGNGAIRLYLDTPDALSPQVATLNKLLLVGSGGASLRFRRTLGYATPTQVCRLQVSTDGGASWTDAWSESGKGGVSGGSASLTVSLDAWAGRTIRLRLRAEDTVSRYVGADSGWTFSDLAFSGIDALGDEREQRSSDGGFTLAAAQPGDYLLLPRVQYQGLYYSDAGAAAYLRVEGALLHGPLASYRVSRDGELVTIRDLVGADGVQTVRNPFRLDFSDLTLAFDVDGNAGKAYRLYRAVLGRQPDSGGLGFWIAGLDGGVGLETMAREFITSQEFVARYGAAPSNQAMVNALYRNVLGREPDAGGAAFWLRQLDDGVALASVLAAFSEGQENRGITAAETAPGIAFARR